MKTVAKQTVEAKLVHGRIVIECWLEWSDGERWMATSTPVPPGQEQMFLNSVANALGDLMCGMQGIAVPTTPQPHARTQLDKLSKETRGQLSKAGLNEEDIIGSTPSELFEKWCNYEGLIWYSDRLMKVMDELRAAYK